MTFIKFEKQVFVASSVADFREKSFTEATHVVDETETLLCENHRVVVVGVFPTEGPTRHSSRWGSTLADHPFWGPYLLPLGLGGQTPS